MNAARALDVALVAAIGLVLLVPLVQRVAHRRFDPFEPLVIFAVAFGVMFVLRPAAMIATNSLVHEGPRRTLDVSATFTEMLVLALLGACAFVAGYWLIARRPTPEFPERPADDGIDRGRLILLAVLLGLLGVMSFAFVLVTLNGVGTLVDILRLGREADLATGIETYRYAWMGFLAMIPAAIIVLALGIERRSKPLLALFLLLAVLILVRAVPLGQRIALLPFLGGAFVLFYVARSKRPSIATLAVLGLVAIFASALLSDVRGRETRGETVLQSIARASSPPRLVSSLAEGPDTEMAPVLAAALAVIPERLPHGYGRIVFGDLLVRPIPRPLWDGKPRPPREQVIAAVWPIEHANRTMQPEFSVLLYFYWDLGLLGVFAGLSAYGAGAAFLYRYYLAHRRRLHGQVIYALALSFVVIGMRDGPVDTLITSVFVIAPALVIFRLARAEGQSRSSEEVATAAPPAR